MDKNNFYAKFSTKNNCLDVLERVFWQGKPYCPYCKSTNYTDLKGEKRYHCNSCNTSFSVTVGSAFHKTKVDLNKWFYAIYINTNKKEYLSARQLGYEIDVTKDTALYMLKRIKRFNKECEDLINYINEIQ